MGWQLKQISAGVEKNRDARAINPRGYRNTVKKQAQKEHDSESE